jgi:hypothetical protein
MEGIGLGVNIGVRASGHASYRGGSSAVGAPGTIDVGATVSASIGVIIKFGVQIHAIMQSINKVFRSGANKVTTQAHGGGNPPGWTNTGSHWVSGSGDNVETFIDKLEQDGYQINRDENDWNNGSPKKHGMHKFDLYNLLKSAGYNDQNLTDREVSIPLAAIEKLVAKRAAKANVDTKSVMEHKDYLGLYFSSQDVLAGNCNDHIHNHRTYTTNSGVQKNIFKADGRLRSENASKYLKYSKYSKGIAMKASVLSTGL